MPSREITEKTGELNVCGEILGTVRSRWPNAYWLGISTLEEATTGVDAELRAGGAGLSFLQFKAPLPGREKGQYRFTLNVDQLENLRIVSTAHPHSAFYVLPALTTRAELEAAAPNLLSRTCFVDVEDMGGFQSTGQSFQVILARNGRAHVEQVTDRSVRADCLCPPELLTRLAGVDPFTQDDRPALEEALLSAQPGLRRPAVLVLR